jgi:wyosine [tRNA(Phe)-imidazoG37] synthetase (radical SAM superfamily)
MKEAKNQAGKITLIIPRHPPNWDNFIWNNFDKVVYGPVDSRRLGSSLGINLFPGKKFCTFNCIYCDCGWTKKYFTEDERFFTDFSFLREQIYNGLKWHKQSKTRIDYITFAGNGEPTIHPRFSDTVQYIYKLRAELFPGIPIALFTNGTMLGDKKVERSLAKIDKKIFKIDASDEQTFNRISKPSKKYSLKNIVNNMAKFDNFCLSSAVIMDSKCSNYFSLKSNNYIEIIRTLNPIEVHLYTIDHPTPPSEYIIKKGTLNKEIINKMLELSEFIASDCQIEVKAYTRRESCKQTIE